MAREVGVGAVWAGEGQSGGVCLQLVLITELMWRSDLKHTLTLQSQVKAGYGFLGGPFTGASVSQSPLLEHRETVGLIYRETLLSNSVMENCGAMKPMGVFRCGTYCEIAWNSSENLQRLKLGIKCLVELQKRGWHMSGFYSFSIPFPQRYSFPVPVHVVCGQSTVHKHQALVKWLSPVTKI